jgi:hypothetical protein
MPSFFGHGRLQGIPLSNPAGWSEAWGVTIILKWQTNQAANQACIGVLYMAKFRADHYLTAEFSEISDTKAVGEKVLEALKELDELKDLAIISRRMEGRSWSEILGRIDIPEGSKAFWAMIKKERTEREPYHLFIRFDMNAEAEDIEMARLKVKSWIEENVVPRIEKKAPVQTIRVLQPNELYMPTLE